MSVEQGRAFLAEPEDEEHDGVKEFNLPAHREYDQIDDRQLRILTKEGFTVGLAKSLAKTESAFPLRLWIIDNSGSMLSPDGHRIVESRDPSQNIKIVDCTRWAEIRDCISYHVKMAAVLNAPSHFRFLNDPELKEGDAEFGIAETSVENLNFEVENALRIMRQTTPAGSTPLANHVRDIHRIIEAMAPDLEYFGHRVSIILATDGLPTDEEGSGGDDKQKDFVEALRLLEGLPVWVVIRLCTDEDKVVDFYNNVDEQLDLNLEVLDDFVGEAHEVFEHNSWLTYGLPLHRCREMGYHDRVFDMIDERPLTLDEMMDMCMLLFGEESFERVPDPAADWMGYLREIEKMLRRESLQWNPVTKEMTPWLDLIALNEAFGDGSLY